LFRHLLLQIGGANIEDPPSSSSLAEEERLARCQLLAPLAEAGAAAPAWLGAAVRDFRRSQL
jgi:hypothetical protein